MIFTRAVFSRLLATVYFLAFSSLVPDGLIVLSLPPAQE